MRKVYYISGLGADERVFTNLKLENAECTYIKWEQPKYRESIQDYAKRLITQIDLNKKVTLVGVSFGGIVAQEIAQHIAVEKIYIISSVKSEKEYSNELKLVRLTKIHKIVPSFLLKKMNLITGDYYFSIKSKEESKLLKSIIHDTDNNFLVWAINEIMKWKKQETKVELIHIHGDDDKIFTKRKVNNVIWVKGGGHFMVLNKAEEISEIINNN